MLEFFTHPQDARVVVIEPQVALRSAIVEALRVHGFAQISGFRDLKTLIDNLPSERPDWVLASSGTENDFNILHLLKLATEEPTLRKFRISLLLREHEKDLLPLSFEFGLLSFHITNIPSRLADDFGELLRILRVNGYSGTLASTQYLNRVLKEKQHWAQIIDLQKSLLELFPGSSQILLTLAEAQLSAGHDEGYRTLQQVAVIDPSMRAAIDQIRQHFPQKNPEPGPSVKPADPNVLGVATCLLVDPDTSIHMVVKQSLIAIGVAEVVCFESGRAAWDWLIQGGQPGIVLMEWKIPDLGGLQLVQRLRDQLFGIPVVLLTSLVTQADFPLLRESGVHGIVEKPFETRTMLADIISVLQQHRYPTEQSALDRKILHYIKVGNKSEASRLLAAYLTERNFTETGKLRMEAEYAFSEGQYQQCCQLVMDGLKISNDSVELLNLLGKVLIKLGDFATALRFFEKANTIAPHNLERICRMSSTCLELGRIKEAESYLAKAKAIDVENILVVEVEASMALENNDVERASEAMNHLENLQRIVAFTNNKAVAKIRNNQFGEGISLYKTALESLPKPWGNLHNTVSFNLALAHVRHEDYQEALAVLAAMQTDSTTPWKQKVSAMTQKLEHAIKNKKLLQFHVDSKPVETSAASPLPFNSQALLNALVPLRGDICCFRIYQARELASETTRKNLLNIPRYNTSTGKLTSVTTKSTHSG